MSITITQVITTDEYLSVFPQDEAVEETAIQSAINRATISLDGICGGMIEKVWPISNPQDPAYDPTSTLYRTTTEIGYIKRAVALQAQYNVSRNLDFTAGSENYSSGSNNYNETRSRPDLVADETIYQLLAQARVYNPNITTDTSIAGDNLEGFYNPSYDPSQNYVTYQVGDNRYVFKHWTDAAGKFVSYDTNGNVVAKTISASESGTSTTPAFYLTIGDTEYQLGGNSHARYIELYGNSGTITDEQLEVLSGSTNNYIWWAQNSTDTSGFFLYATQWNPDVSATYENIYGNSNYKLSIDVVAKTYTMTITGIAGTWGSITGTITNQTDLQDQFATKQAKVTYSATEPTNPQDNDIWVQESISSATQQHLYEHNISFEFTDNHTNWGFLKIYNNNETSFTIDTLSTYVKNNNIDPPISSNITYQQIDGNWYIGNYTHIDYYNTNAVIWGTFIYLNNGTIQRTSRNVIMNTTNITSFTDTVIQIF